MNCCTDPEYTWKGTFDYDAEGNPYAEGKCINCETEVKEVYTSGTIIEK